MSNPNINDYILMDKLKLSLVNRLRKMGLEEETEDLSDKDLSVVVYALWKVIQEASKHEDNKDLIEHLTNYIAKLLTMLVVTYKVDKDDL